MANFKVLTYDNLSVIKDYIDVKDTQSLKTATLVGNVLKLYNVPEPVGTTEPVYEIELPETDISGLLAKLTGAVEGDVVIANADGTVKDSGVKLDDLATDAELKEVSDKVAEHTEALEALNNADTGFIAQAEDYTDTKIQELTNGAIKDNADAIAAINDADTGILKTAQTYADEKVEDLAEGQVKTNKEAIEKLTGDAETEGSVAKAVKDASDAINAKIGTVEEGKTVVGMIEEVIANGYDDEEVRELIGDNADAIAELDGEVGDLTTLKTTEKATIVGAINELSDGKADKATTIAGYGITDAYTKTEVDSAITTAVANAEHLKRSIVTALPEVASADAHTIYMVEITGGDGNQKYEEFMLINGAFEKIGDSAVDLTDYATKAYADQAEADAKTYADDLNTAMDERVTQLETDMPEIIAITEDEIKGLFTV